MDVQAGGPPGRDTPVVILRQTRRLVRYWAPLDGLLYNVMAMNVFVMFNLPLLTAVAYFQSGSILLAIAIAVSFCLAEAVVYSFLGSSIPRSGGDYVFQSRLLSGAVGTVFAFTAAILAGAIWMAIGAWIGVNAIIAPFLFLFGYRLESETLVGLGRAVVSPAGVLLVSVVLTGWCALINVWGLRAYARCQRVAFCVGLAALGYVLWMLISSSPESVAANVDKLGVEAFGTSDLRSTVVERALSLGFKRSGDTGVLVGTLAMIPAVAFPFIYPAWSVQQGGEIRHADRLTAQVRMIVLAEVITAALTMVVIGLLVSRFGKEFLGAAAYLWLEHREAFPIPAAPLIGFLIGVMGDGLVSLCVVTICFNAWFWMWAPDITLGASRVLLAMSSDRLLPRWLGRVGRRSRSPILAIGVFSGLCVVAEVLYSYTGLWRLSLDVTLLNVLAFGVTCAAGAAFPFTKRELYRASTAARYEILRVPLITIAGGLFCLFTLFLLWRFLTDHALFLGLSLPVSILVVAVVYLLALGLYHSFRYYRRTREGIDIEVSYQEIPVE